MARRRRSDRRSNGGRKKRRCLAPVGVQEEMVEPHAWALGSVLQIANRMVSNIGAVASTTSTFLYRSLLEPNDRRNKRLWGQKFIDIIMDDSSFVPIEDSDGMSYVPKIPKLETGRWAPLIVRKITQAFWKACLQVVDDDNLRVAAIGTSGIGKTASTSILIRMLLKEHKTVVYHIRTNAGKGWIYEFVSKDGAYEVDVYRERELYSIPSIKFDSAYYIVDPSETWDSCNPAFAFLAKVIIVTSPTETHLGGSEFGKYRDGIRGVPRYYPVWSEEELWAAWPLLGRHVEDEDAFLERYRLFGGVPGRFFASEPRVTMLLNRQDAAVSRLSVDQVREIGSGCLDAVNTPGSPLLAYELAPEDNGQFANERAILVSSGVKDKLYSSHIGLLWNTMIRAEREECWCMFEAYGRFLLASPEIDSLDFRSRVGVSRQRRNIGTDGRERLTNLKVRCCREIKFVDDPVAMLASGDSKPFVLYHSRTRNFPVIDCVYKNRQRRVFAFRFTISENQEAPIHLIRDVQARLRAFPDVKLFYLVPSDVFPDFETTPSDPMDYEGITIKIRHVAVPNPDKDELPKT
jgi:hypothetical protein